MIRFAGYTLAVSVDASAVAELAGYMLTQTKAREWSQTRKEECR